MTTTAEAAAGPTAARDKVEPMEILVWSDYI